MGMTLARCDISDERKVTSRKKKDVLRAIAGKWNVNEFSTTISQSVKSVSSSEVMPTIFLRSDYVANHATELGISKELTVTHHRERPQLLDADILSVAATFRRATGNIQVCV